MTRRRVYQGVCNYVFDFGNPCSGSALSALAGLSFLRLEINGGNFADRPLDGRCDRFIQLDDGLQTGKIHDQRDQQGQDHVERLCFLYFGQ